MNLWICITLVVVLYTVASEGEECKRSDTCFKAGEDCKSSDSCYRASDLVVNTECGHVEGQQINGVHRFAGIPYALQPLGSRRWSEPVPLSMESGTCWKGTYEAFEFKNSCVQRSTSDLSIIGNEDCLYLNVWRPALITKPLPVLVWIHGGYLIFGNGNYPTYSPNENVVKDTNMVYVSMNYRLSAFGFMALDLLSKHSSSRTSGNYGFLDQILVLQWVQKNIRNFGGDPHQVTLFGQSSGGTSIFALLASPMASGLFHKAWIMSASPILNKTLTETSKDNEIFLKNTGCSDLMCLQKLPADDIMKAVSWDEFPFWQMSDLTELPTYRRFNGALPVVDGYVLPDAPFVAFAKGNGNDVPLIIGTTAQEVDFEPPSNLIQADWVTYETEVKKKLAPFGEGIAETALKMYPSGEVTPEYQYTTMTSDLRVTCESNLMATYIARHFRSPVYRYILVAQPSKPVLLSQFGVKIPSSYSFHAFDIFAFFKTINLMIQTSPKDIEFENNIQNEILSFVNRGKPSTSDWLPYPSRIALLSDTTKVVDEYGEDKCLFWLANGFGSYSWIN